MAAEFSGLTLLVMMMVILIYAMHEFAEHWVPKRVRKRLALQLLTMGLAIFGDSYAAITGSTLDATMAMIALLVMLGELAVHRSIASFLSLARLVIPPQYPVLTVTLLIASLSEDTLKILKRREEKRSVSGGGEKREESPSYEEYMGE